MAKNSLTSAELKAQALASIKNNPTTMDQIKSAIESKPGASKNGSAATTFNMIEKTIGLNSPTASAPTPTPTTAPAPADLSYLPGRKPGAVATGPIVPISSVDGGQDASFLRTGATPTATDKSKEVEKFYSGDALVQQWKATHPTAGTSVVTSGTKAPVTPTAPTPTPPPVPKNMNQDKADSEFKTLDVAGADRNAIAKQIFDKYGIYPSGWDGTNTGVNNSSALERLKGTNVGSWLADYENLPSADKSRLKPMADMLYAGATEEAVSAYFSTNAQALATMLNIPLDQAMDLVSPDMKTKRLTAIDEINKKYSIDYLANEKLYAVAGNKAMEKFSWDYIKEHDTALQSFNDQISDIEQTINTSGNPWMNQINSAHLTALKQMRDDRFSAYSTLVNKSIDQSAEKARFAIDMYTTFTDKATNEINQAMTGITEGQTISQAKLGKIESWIKSTYDDIVFGFSEASDQSRYNTLRYSLTEAQVKEALANADKNARGNTKQDDIGAIVDKYTLEKSSTTNTFNGTSVRTSLREAPDLDLKSLQSKVGLDTSSTLSRDTAIGQIYATNIRSNPASYVDILAKIKSGYGTDYDALANGNYSLNKDTQDGFTAMMTNVNNAIGDTVINASRSLNEVTAAKISTDVKAMKLDKFVSTYGGGNPFTVEDAKDLFERTRSSGASVDTVNNIRKQLLEIYLNRTGT